MVNGAVVVANAGMAPAYAPTGSRGFGAPACARNQPALAEAQEVGLMLLREERVPRSAGRPAAQSEARQQEQPRAPERDR